MKALLISESDEILNSYATFFKEAGYDTVCYRWLLKAMDNLEEIEPQLVFIDGFGYPRHWKTLAQYIKTSFKNVPLVLLAADLSEEETKKADCLDVHCIRGLIDDAQTRRDILSLLHPEQEQAAVFSQTPVAVDRLPEQSAELIEATEPAEIAEPVGSEELAKTADFPEPVKTVEPEIFAPEPVEAFEELEVPAQTSLSGDESVSASAEKLAEFAEPSEGESANPEPTTAPSLNDGESVSACAGKLAEFAAEPVQPVVEPAKTAESVESEGLAECEVEPVQPVVEPAEQSAELIEATEPTEIAEPVGSEEFIETADFPEPAEIAEPETFAPEPEMSAPPFSAAIAEPKKEPEVSAEPVERFEEPEQVDDEPFFKAVPPVKTSLSRDESVSAAQTEEPEVTTAGDNEVFSFTFFHPRTKTAIYGSTVSFKPPLLYFKPDDSSVLRTLRFGQKSSGVINDKGLASKVSVQIQGFENGTIELCLLK